MKILLTAINAKYIHSNPAIYSLSAYASEYRENIESAEFTINNTTEHILEGIYRRCPDVLCFSCYIWNITSVKRAAEAFHLLRPDVPIWVGGPEVSFETDRFLKENDWCTGIMTGEGEETFRELVEYYVGNRECLTGIRSIVFRPEGGERFVHTPVRESLDLSAVPFIYKDMRDFENRIVYYESSRGCPFNCSYCLSSVEKSLRFRSIDLVKNELKFFLDHKVPQVKFVDRTFNIDHEHAISIWKYITDNDNGVTNFHFEVSADLLSEDEMELMSHMRPGLIQLEIGVQSTNPETIGEIHRTMKLEKVKTAVRRIQSAGNIHMHLDLIAGLPFEDIKSFRRSFNEIYSLKPEQLQLGFLKVLKGSYMYEHAGEYGIISSPEPPYEVMRTNWIDYEDILTLKHIEEMVEVYYNSGQYNETVKVLEILHDDPYEMFENLAEFYDRKGYFNISHNRMRRAEIILEYTEHAFSVREDFDDIRDVTEQALTFDLYLRENCKSRPAWAADLSLLKQATRRYCPNGRNSHVEPFDYIFAGSGKHTPCELPKRQQEKVWYLFDYLDRSPLDNSAGLKRVYPDAPE